MKIPTAEEFWREVISSEKEFNMLTDLRKIGLAKHVFEAMRRFATLHTEESLRRAYKNARIEKNTGEKAIVFGSSRDGICESFSICKHSITNAYPTSKIK